MISPQKNRRIPFGPFEADPGTRELFRDGVRIPIQGRPFRILELLLQAEDGLVTRDALFHALWPDTHVDRNRCLNTAMQKLRAALAPENEEGRLIETLGSLGYRLRTPRVQVPEASFQTRPLRLVLLAFKEAGPGTQDGFCLGLREQLAARLGRELRQVTVLAPVLTPPEHHNPSALRDLHADVLLTGSVSLEALRINISAQLISATDQTCLWTDTFGGDLVLVQEELARATVGAILRYLAPPVQAAPRLATHATTYQKYLQGLHHFTLATEPDFLRAIELLQQVIAEDDGFAPAHTTLALLYSYTAHFGPLAPDQVYPRVESLIAHSLSLDTELPESHVVLGMAKMLYRADFQGAETAFRKAIKLNPSLPRAYLGFSQICTLQGRHRDAILALHRGMDLDPRAPELGVMLACAHYFAGDLSAAMAQIDRTLKLHPGFSTALSTAGWIHSALGAHERALQCLQEATSRTPDSPILQLHLAQVLATAGRSKQARSLLGEVVELRRSAWISPYAIALVHLALKQPATALRWFERAIHERDGWRVLSGVDPRLAPLAAHQGFRSLLTKAGLPCPFMPPPAPARKPPGKPRSRRAR